MVQLSGGAGKLIPKYYLEVYFGVDKSQIKDKHVILVEVQKKSKKS